MSFVLHTHSLSLPLSDAADVYSVLTQNTESPSFLYESRSINPLYGRMSLLGISPILEIHGKNNTVAIRLLEERGTQIFQDFVSSFSEHEISQKSEKEVLLSIPRNTDFLPEKQKTRRKNIATALHHFFEQFSVERKTLMGLFGAFSYDFSRLFEDIPDMHEDRGVADFHLFLFDSFVRFDLITQKSEILCIRQSPVDAQKASSEILEKISHSLSKKPSPQQYQTGNITCDTEKEAFEQKVRTAKRLAEHGEVFEVVFSREFSGEFTGSPFALYQEYREQNPAPYLFYFNFKTEQIVGASPEMMVRVEDTTVHLRPISGTRPRGDDPISDHENELELLSCHKERAELDMLIDLGRNDLRRICTSGIEITAYRHVEKYSRVMHTIAHLTGTLSSEYSALDALIACQSAGTLTGAPKVQAMKEIEKHETSRRGYYGGSIGYITLSGEMDTGIIIRSAHIRDGRFCFRVGSTLLHDSIPEDEFRETENKARALLELLRGKTRDPV